MLLAFVIITMLKIDPSLLDRMAARGVLWSAHRVLTLTLTQTQTQTLTLTLTLTLILTLTLTLSP